MPFPEITRLSPNRALAPVHEQLGVVLHHTVLTFTATLERLLDPLSQVSYHCVIDRDGARCTLVEDPQIAWHAGVSQFRGRSHCNAFLLGLAFAGDSYAAPLTDAQIASAIDWIEPRWRRQHWDLSRITDHRQVAPGRKDDLNPVEWERVHAALALHFRPPAAPAG